MAPHLCLITLVLSLPTLGLAAPAPKAPPAPAPKAAEASIAEQIKGFWLGLEAVQNGCPAQFTLEEGGLRTLACHLQGFGEIPSLEAWVGAPVFLSGPHKAGALKLDEAKTFGHYNPKFVAWAADHLLPGVKDPKVRAATQAIYDKKLKRLVSALYLTKIETFNKNVCFKREVEAYKSWLKGEDLNGMPHTRYFYFFNKEFCQNADYGWRFFEKMGGVGKDPLGRRVEGNLVGPCVAWWIRRDIDGTAEAWWRGVEALVKAYDPELAKRFR